MLFLSQSEKETTHDVYMICKNLIEYLIPTFLQVISQQTLVQSIMAASGIFTTWTAYLQWNPVTD